MVFKLGHYLLGADQLLSAKGFHKDYACKLFPLSSSLDRGWSCIISYAGYPAVFDSFKDRLRDAMKHLDEQGWNIRPSDVRDALVEIIKVIYSDSMRTELLCGIRLADGSITLFKTDETI